MRPSAQSRPTVWPVPHRSRGKVVGLEPRAASKSWATATNSRFASLARSARLRNARSGELPGCASGEVKHPGPRQGRLAPTSARPIIQRNDQKDRPR